MLVNEKKFDAPAYSVEHLFDVPNYKRLIEDFTAGNDAAGLESYLKFAATGDELACYFSLRTGLITIQVAGDDFDSLPAIELSNFAVNDAYRKKHKETKKLGVHIFDVFILPIARFMAQYIGANSLYIYALPFNKLIEHYATMGFSMLPEDQEKFVQSHVKPKYDAGCRFMYQTL